MSPELENNNLGGDQLNQEKKPEFLGDNSVNPEDISTNEKISEDVSNVEVQIVAPKPEQLVSGGNLESAHSRISTQRERINAAVKRIRQRQYGSTIVDATKFINDIETASSRGGAKSAAFYASVTDQTRGLKQPN